MAWYGSFSPTGAFMPNSAAGLGADPTADPYQQLFSRPSYNTPPIAPPQNVEPAEAFTWGAGGQRLTPDQIAQKDKVAQALVAGGMDYSPVQSWAQGLARVAQGVLGGIEERHLDKQTAANAAANQAIVQALVSGGGDNSKAALSALTSPYSDDGTRAAAKLVFEAANRKPAQPHYWETNNGSLFKVGDDGQPVPVYNDPTPKMNFIPDGLGGGQWLAVPDGPTTVPDPVKPVGKLTPITTGGASSDGSRTFPLR